MTSRSLLAIWTFFTVDVYRVQAQIKVLSPSSLKRDFIKTNGVILGATSVFGAPFYGERVLGRLRGGMIRGKSHCRDGDYDFKPTQDELNAQGETLLEILVLPHSSATCSAVSKVMVAQGKGAHAVILVDDTHPPLSDKKLLEAYPQDDGYGGQVQIPSILVSQETGNKIYNAMRLDLVIVELAWDIPVREVASLDFWHSSAALEAANFLKKFAEPAELLANLIEFIPRYYIFEVPEGGGAGDLCAEFGNPSLKSNVRHCAPDPDGDGPITGAEVALEDVRQLCLFHQTKFQQSEDMASSSWYSKHWWDYVTTIHDRCPMDALVAGQRFGSQECSLMVMEYLGVPLDYITHCLENDAESLLEEQARNQAWSEQALRINGWRYKGTLDSELVLKAVCQSYPVPPTQCEQLLNGFVSRMIYLVTHRITKGISTNIFELMLGGILILGLINCYLYKRCLMRMMKSQMREEVMLEVQSQMTEYSKLEH